MRRYALELDEYERDNLLWLLDAARKVGFDTGDWLNQVRFRLEPDLGAGRPNCAAPAEPEPELRLAVGRWLNR